MSNAQPDTTAVWEALASIPDPEFGVNIVDLGLIYYVGCVDGKVSVVMTLTTPTCPSGSWIHGGAEAVLQRLPDVVSVKVDLVFDPPWNTEMLSKKARRDLGWDSEEME